MDYGKRTKEIMETVKKRVSEISKKDEYNLIQCGDDTIFKIIYETLWTDDNQWYIEEIGK